MQKALKNEAFGSNFGRRKNSEEKSILKIPKTLLLPNYEAFASDSSAIFGQAHECVFGLLWDSRTHAHFDKIQTEKPLCFSKLKIQFVFCLWAVRLNSGWSDALLRFWSISSNWLVEFRQFDAFCAYPPTLFVICLNLNVIHLIVTRLPLFSWFPLIVIPTHCKSTESIKLLKFWLIGYG